jgi:tetratricopeptide (TPR) repeat protein
VTSFYGIGGIGKTALLKRLASQMEEKAAGSPYVCHDFNVVREPRCVLDALRNRLAKVHGFSFPLFDIAMFVYAKKAGEKVNENDCGGLIEKSPVLSLAFSVLGMLPVVGIASRYVALADKGGGILKNILSKRKRELYEIEAEPIDAVYRKLPYYFALDLAENLRARAGPLVVFFDTYEALVNEMSGAGEQTKNDLWIRGPEGLIQNAPRTLWVIAGREKLKWARFDADWESSLDQHILGSLSPADSKYFLELAGIGDAAIIDSIYNVTAGTPAFLDLCADNYYALTERGRKPVAEDFGGNAANLVERYVRYLDDGKKDVVYLLSCLRIWNDDVFRAVAGEVIPNYSYTSYEKIKGSSFVFSREDGVFCMNAGIRGILYRECPGYIKERAEAAVSELYRKKTAAAAVTGVDFGPVFSLYLEYSLQTIRSGEALADFYRETKKTLDKIYLAGQFDMLNSAMSLLSEFAERTQSGAEAAAMISADRAKCLVEAGDYKKALEQAERARDIFVRLFGEAHESSIAAVNSISRCHDLLGRCEESMALAEKACELARANLGAKHPLTADTLYRMANRLMALGDYGRALEFGMKALSCRREIYGDDAMETVNVLETVAKLHARLGREDEAAEICEQALMKRRAVLGGRHPHALIAMNNLAYRYARTKRWNTALPLAEEAVSAQSEIFGEDHINVAPSLETLSECCSALGEHQRAVSLQKTACEIYRRVLGGEHKNTNAARSALAERLEAAANSGVVP